MMIVICRGLRLSMDNIITWEGEWNRLNGMPERGSQRPTNGCGNATATTKFALHEMIS